MNKAKAPSLRSISHLARIRSEFELAHLDWRNNPANWQLAYTSFPNGITYYAPFYKEDLFTEAPRLQVIGSVGGDVLSAFVRLCPP